MRKVDNVNTLRFAWWAAEEQEQIWEGVAGESYDPCYHEACDSLDATHPDRDPAVYAELTEENDLVGSVSREALGVNSDAIAFTLPTPPRTSTASAVSGCPGSRPLRLPTEPAGTGGDRRLRRRRRARPRGTRRLTRPPVDAERRSPTGPALLHVVAPPRAPRRGNRSRTETLN